MIGTRRIQAITSLIVLAHLFGWGTGALALSVTSATMAGPHMMSFAYEHGELHLILHHSSNHNGHGQAIDDLEAYVTPTGQDQHPDHEIHLSDYDHPLTTTTKTLGNSETFASTEIAWLLVDQVEKTFLSCVPGHPPDAIPHLRSLRTVVLLI